MCCRRSIPARAGQPGPTGSPRLLCPVYPRTRGATLSTTASPDVSVGLSPHARGNPSLWGRARPTGRSIPARAGQPPRTPLPPGLSGVYPRTRGATLHFGGGRGQPDGLSPHARGNRSLGRCRAGPLRSIPARAGQPVRQWSRKCGDKVYPRTRGATCQSCPKPTARYGLSPHARGNLPGAASDHA